MSNGLCHRCEQRARFYETGSGARCECATAGAAVYSCYAYRPVTPAIIASNKDDNRPMFAGWMFSGRSHFVRTPTVNYTVAKYKDGFMLYILPKEEELEKDKPAVKKKAGKRPRISSKDVKPVRKKSAVVKKGEGKKTVNRI